MNFMTAYEVDTSLSDFRDIVRELKMELLAGTITCRKNLETWKLDSFKINLKNFLHQYKVYGTDIGKSIRTVQLPTTAKVRTIRYDMIKELIFSNPDYLSIGGFAAGLIRGVTEDGFTNATDIDDFFKHTIDSAFRYNVESSGELIEKCQFIRDDGVEEMDTLNIKLFDTLSTYPDLFRVTDVGSIFTATTKAMDIMVRYFRGRCDIDIKRRVLDIAILNSFCEYLFFTVTSYALRTFMIGYYYWPIYDYAFPVTVRSDNGIGLSESTEVELDELYPASGCQFAPLVEIDQSDVLDPSGLMQFLSVYRQLVTMIGVNPTSTPADNRPGAWCSDATKASFNRIVIDTGLSSNVLLAKVIKSENYYDYSEQRSEVPINISELFHNLKSSIGNSHQALQLNGSAKDDILKVITTVGSVKSLADLRLAAADSLILSASILMGLGDKLKIIADSGSEASSIATIGNTKLISECHLMMLELYHDLASASYDKALTLEKLYRQLTMKRGSEMERATEINVDGLMNSTTTKDTPDTMRVSIDMLPKYQQPIFEYYELRDEYLRSLAGFGDDQYLTEAGMSDLINAVTSLIQGLIASCAAFFKNFKLAADWVKAKQEALNSLTFEATDKLEGVYQYKIKDHSKLTKGLMPDSIRANINKPAEEFITSLYPTPAYRDTFEKSETKALASMYWKNNYLFGVNSGKEIPTVTLTGKDISDHLKIWIEDILQQEAIMKTLNDTNAGISESIKYLKAEAVKTSAKPAVASDAAPEVKLSPEEQKAAAAENKTTPKKVTPPPQNNKPAEPVVDNRLVRVQTALNEIWLPVYNGMIRAMRDEYGYIKKAYAISQGKNAKPEASAGETTPTK